MEFAEDERHGERIDEQTEDDPQQIRGGAIHEGQRRHQDRDQRVIEVRQGQGGAIRGVDGAKALVNRQAAPQLLPRIEEDEEGEIIADPSGGAIGAGSRGRGQISSTSVVPTIAMIAPASPDATRASHTSASVLIIAQRTTSQRTPRTALTLRLPRPAVPLFGPTGTVAAHRG